MENRFLLNNKIEEGITIPLFNLTKIRERKCVCDIHTLANDYAKTY